MATSGSVDFTVTRNEIINDAFYHTGVLGEGETLSGADMDFGIRQLNKMIKAWGGQGFHLWTLTEREIMLTVDQKTYTIGPDGDLDTNRPNKIHNARWSDSSNNETPIHIVSRQEYMALPNKATSGKPTIIYYDRQLSKGTIYVWPVADDATDRLLFTAEDHIEDFDTSSDDTPFPQEWAEAISWNLALRLLGRERVDGERKVLIRENAAMFLAQAITFDAEENSVVFGLSEY